MPQIYEAELSDGRIVEFESDHDPTEADVLAAIQGPAPAPIQPTPAEPITPQIDPRRAEIESQVRQARAESVGGKALETLAGFGEQVAAAVAAMPGAPFEVAHRLVPTQPLISPEQGEAAARFFNPFPAPEGSLVRGVEKGVGQMISGVSDPLALAQMVLGKRWPKPIAKGFQAQMMLGVPQAAQEVAKAQTPEELGASGVGLTASAGFPLLIEAQLRKSAATLPASAKAASEAGTKKGVASQEATAIELLRETRKSDELQTGTPATPQSGFGLSQISSEQSPSIAWLEGIASRNQKAISNAENALLGKYVEGEARKQRILGGTDIEGTALPTPSFAGTETRTPLTEIGARPPQERGWLGQLTRESYPDDSRSTLERAPFASPGPLGTALRFLLDVSDENQAALGARTLLDLLSKESSPQTKQVIQQYIEEIIYARKNFTPATLHGFMRSLAREGQRQVPPAEGGTRVQPQAQGVAKEGKVLLTPEESSYLEAERTALDVPVEVSDVTPEGQPFAGDISVADRPNQRIIINPQGFSEWLAKLREGRRAGSVRSLLGEERIHLAVDDPSAQAYANTLTALEKAIIRRRYTGNWRGINVTTGDVISDLTVGHEGLRFRLQQFARMLPREFAETDFLSREGLTIRSITAIENALRGVREVLGTKASQESLAIIKRIQGNLDAAKAVLAGAGRPAAIRKNTVDEIYDKQSAERRQGVAQIGAEVTGGTKQAIPGPGTTGIAEETGGIGVSENQGRQGLVSDYGPAGPEQLTPIEPAAIRKGKPVPKEQEAFDLPPVKAGQVVERPGAGFIPPKATELDSIAARHFERAIAAGEVPDFNKFRMEVGESIPEASLYYLWQDAMMKRLVTAKGEQVAKLMGQLGVTRDVAQALHPGESAPKLGGSIPDAQIFTRGQQIVMPSLGRIAKAQYARQMMPEQRRRHAALGAIMDKLMEQAGEKPVKPWTRTGIGPEDIMQRYNVLSAATPEEVAKVGVEGVQAPEIESRPMFRTFTPEEASNPTTVGDIATTGAAVEATGKGAPPRTVSRNLVALKDESGRIVLVSAWRDPRTGPKVTNPLGASFPGEKIDSALLRKWKPVVVMSLRDPVQNYRDVFGSQEAFDSYFGDIGIEGTPGIRTGMFAGPEAGMAEAQAGIRAPGTVAPPREDLLTALGKPEFVSPTAKELTMPIERIPPTVVRGEQLPKGPGPEPTLPAPRPPEMLPEKPPLAEAEVGRSTMAAPSYGKPTGKIVEYGKPTPIQPGTYHRLGVPPELGRRMPAAIRKDLSKIGGSLVTKVLVNPMRLYSEWMPERLARAAMEAGDPNNPRLFTISEAFKDAANIIIDQEKKNYGSLVDVLDPAKKAAGQFGKDTTWANKPRPITPKAATRNAVDAVEGTIPIPPFAKELIDLAKAANLRIGELLEKHIPGFKAGGKWQRNLTGLGYDIMRQGSGDAWNDWVMGTAKANYKPTYVDAKGKTHRSPPFKQYVEIVKKTFREYKAVLDDPMADTATIEKVNQDFVRVLPQTITDIKIMGMWQPVIHGNLFNYLENAARRATHASAFREVFPLSARGAYRKMMEEMRAELPPQFQKDLEALNRALQGHPTDTYAGLDLIGPGEPIGEAFRFLNNTLGNFFSKLVLSGQMAVQTGEMISGSSPLFLGDKNFLRAVARLKHLYAESEQRGLTNRVMYDMSWDPASPVRSAFRIGGNVISRTFMEQWSNEMQELHAAVTATVVTERIKAGTLDAWEKRMLPETFKDMGFSPPQVSEMMKGNPELLGQFERKAAAFLTSGNKAIAEGSRLGSNRMFNSIFRFQTYPMMKMNQFRKVTGSMVEAWQKGTPAQKRASTEMFARFLFRNTVQGILTVGVTSLLYEGVFGTGIRAQEAKDEFGNFMLDSFLATVGGPLYLLWRGARDQGAAGIGKQLERTIFPMTVANELIDFAYGTGAYRDRDGFDRIWRFMQQKLPATKAISQGLAMAGLSIEDKKLDAAILAFYRWRRKELGWTDYEPYFREDERRQFRLTMRAAVDAMKRGDSDTYVQKLGEATALQGRKSVKSSLQARRLLQSPTGKDLTPEQLDKLRAHIGDAAVEKLEGFDAMLKALAR